MGKFTQSFLPLGLVKLLLEKTLYVVKQKCTIANVVICFESFPFYSLKFYY